MPSGSSDTKMGKEKDEKNAIAGDKNRVGEEKTSTLASSSSSEKLVGKGHAVRPMSSKGSEQKCGKDGKLALTKPEAVGRSNLSRSESSCSSQNSWEVQVMPEILRHRSQAQQPPPWPTSSLLAAACPPTLHRTDEDAQTPGAYSEAPGHHAVRMEKAHIHHINPVRNDLENLGRSPPPPRQEEESTEAPTGVLGDNANPSDHDVEEAPFGPVPLRDSLLFEATPVDEPSSQDLSQATPVTWNEEARQAAKRRKLRRTAAVILVVSLLFLVGIPLLVFFEEEDTGSSSEIIHTTTTPTMDPTTILLPGLPDYSVIAIISDSTSPQAKANSWLQEDPNLANYTQDRIFQRFALASLYFSTTVYMDENGTSIQSLWTKDEFWLSHEYHECDWFGNRHFLLVFGKTMKLSSQSPCNEQGDYERLWLSGNGLVGTIPLEIYGLLSLTSIDFQQNRGLGGEISSHLGFLTNLEHFSAAITSLSGTVASEIGQLRSLETFNLQFNQFSGTMATEIGLCSHLLRLDLGLNHLSGSIPTEVGLLTRLRSLFLPLNQFTGSLEVTQQLSSQLEYLIVHNNLLTGTLPTEFGAVTSLNYFEVGDNSLSGSIPPDFGGMTELRTFFLSSNSLTGSVPTEIGLWKHLTDLNLYDNNLARLPTEIGLLPLGQLRLGNNLFERMPTEINQLNLLTFLQLNNNQLTSFPILEGGLSSLQYLELHFNSFAESFPSEIGRLSSTLLVLSSNNANWTGRLPSEVGQMHQLRILSLNQNDITGAIPQEWNRLVTNGSLQELNVSDTQLSGTVPLGLCDLSEGLAFDCSEHLCGCDCTCNA